MGDKWKFPVGEFSFPGSLLNRSAAKTRQKISNERTDWEKKIEKHDDTRERIVENFPRLCSFYCCCFEIDKRAVVAAAPMREDMAAYMDQKEIANFLAKELFYQQVFTFSAL